MKLVDDKILFWVKEEVLHIDEYAEVILFGSRARGDSNIDSDWDFLILLSNPLSDEIEKLIRNKIYDIELETGEIITSIIEYKPEWDKYEATTIYKNIREQGLKVA